MKENKIAKKFPNNTRLNYTSKCRLEKNISPQDMKKLDVWDLRILGKKPSRTVGYRLNFLDIYPDWFKQATKEFIWSNISKRKIPTLKQYQFRLRIISNFARDNTIYLTPKNMNRELVIDLINYLGSSDRNTSTVSHILSTYKFFFEFCQQNDFIPKNQGQLIFDEDFPKQKKSLIKDIPEYILKQLKSQQQFLAEPISLMVDILLETGMRISEVCTLKFNCIQQDSDGDWWINPYRHKTDTESLLIITKELTSKILEQQKFIRESFETQFAHLFCSTKGSGWFNNYGYRNQGCKRRNLEHFIPVFKPIREDTLRGYLKQLAREHDIKDVGGEIYPIWKCHQFRHTHLTDLARKGTGIAHIMQRAGHSSPRMTEEYLHLTNDDQKKKMKEVWDNTHFNMEGEIVAPVNPDLDTAEMQWIKKGMGMQTTDNGYCTLLWTQTCPHQDLPCKGCGSWVTTLDFLDSHKKELEETEKIIENARQKGYQRQIEKNVPRAERLKKIISGMEKHQTMRGLGHNEWEEN